MPSRPLLTGTLRFDGVSVRYIHFSHEGKPVCSQVVLSIVWLATTKTTRSTTFFFASSGAIVGSTGGHSTFVKSEVPAQGMNALHDRKNMVAHTAANTRYFVSRAFPEFIVCRVSTPFQNRPPWRIKACKYKKLLDDSGARTRAASLD